MRTLVLAVPLVILLTVGAPARATAQPTPPPLAQGTAEVAFVGTTGNASTSTFGVSGEFIARPDSWTIRNKAGVVRNRSEGETTAQIFTYAGRVQKTYTPRLSSFGEYGYFRDEFAGVSHRHSLAGGIAVRLVERDGHVVSADASIGYLRESRLVSNLEPVLVGPYEPLPLGPRIPLVANDVVSSATYGTTLLYHWTISPTAQLVDELNVTGLVASAADWRLSHVAALTTKLTSSTSLKVSHTVRFAHEPVPGFKRTDTTTAIALVAGFARARP